jgi:3',5'-nucleoside bisphosphate phosphatase
MPGIDLHTHSTASDGTLTPAQLVRAAQAAGLEALALTDHDTAAGLPQALEEGRRIGLEVVPGCELSVTTKRAKMHILGLWLPPVPHKLNAAMRELREHRHNRNHIIIAKLNALGLDISYEEVQAIAGQAASADDSGEGSVGRPHIARLLLAKGLVTSIDEAFSRYLGNHGKAYAPKKVLTAEDAVHLLKEEGATVIMAHPCQFGLNRDELAEEILRLKDYGLDGLEVYYNDHSQSKVDMLLKMARQFGLAVSGGSDFHGETKPDVRLGVGRGSMFVPYSVLEGLKELRAKQGLA